MSTSARCQKRSVLWQAAARASGVLKGSAWDTCVCPKRHKFVSHTEPVRGGSMMELVASFVNRSNLLKLWKKTDPCTVSASGAYGPKNAAITRIPAPYAAYDTVAIHRGPCETLRRYRKLATSSVATERICSALHIGSIATHQKRREAPAFMPGRTSQAVTVLLDFLFHGILDRRSQHHGILLSKVSLQG